MCMFEIVTNSHKFKKIHNIYAFFTFQLNFPALYSTYLTYLTTSFVINEKDFSVTKVIYIGTRTFFYTTIYTTSKTDHLQIHHNFYSKFKFNQLMQSYQYVLNTDVFNVIPQIFKSFLL